MKSIRSPLAIFVQCMVWLAWLQSGLAFGSTHEVTSDGRIAAGQVTVNQSDGEWNRVEFGTRFTAVPVVVMGPPSYRESQPSTIRIRSVTRRGFEFQIDEWDYLDGNHIAETMSYIALVPGEHNLDGQRAVAGRINPVNHTWKTVDYPSVFSRTPVVLTQQVTSLGVQATVTRLRSVNERSFQVRLQEEEGNDGTHANETVDYIAIRPGSGGLPGSTASLIAGRTPNSVTGLPNWYDVDFGVNIDNAGFVARMQTQEGPDPAALRYTDLSAGSVKVVVEEEASSDDELGHAPETVGWLAFSAGEDWAPLQFESAEQRSTSYEAGAERAIDGVTNGDFSGASVTHTSNSEKTWWEGDLGQERVVSKVKIHNRSDCCAGRLQQFHIILTNKNPGTAGQLLDLQSVLETARVTRRVGEAVDASEPYTWNLNKPTTARYVLIYKPANSVLSLAEVEVEGSTDILAASGIKTGAITYEAWEGIGGTAVDSLTEAAPFPENPSITSSLDRFEAPANRGDYYGARIQGYLVPPRSGEYTFWIASDDNSELWLGENQSASSRRLIASVSDWTQAREWDDPGELGQRSVSIELSAGKPYYIEALHKEAAGGDNLSVAWKGPGIATRRIVEGQYLAPYRPEESGPRLYGAWEPSTYDLQFESAEQSATSHGGRAERAIDGNTDGNWSRDSVTHTTNGPNWWEGDLGREHRVTQVRLHNRTDCCADRLQGFHIILTNRDWGESGETIDIDQVLASAESVKYVSGAVGTDGPFVWTLQGPASVRYVLIHKAGNSALSLAEVEVAGSAPLRFSRLGGGSVLYERWAGIVGNSVANLTGAERFPDSPDHETTLKAFEAPVGDGDSYGARMRGYLIPPKTGSYTFWIASDNGSQLWLGDGPDPASRQKIASVSNYTSYRQWNDPEEENQQSGSVTLVAGKPYYIEALHKEGVGGDHLSVAWSGPGISERQVIGAQHLATYGLDPGTSGAEGFGDGDEEAVLDITNFDSPELGTNDGEDCKEFESQRLDEMHEHYRALLGELPKYDPAQVSAQQEQEQLDLDAHFCERYNRLDDDEKRNNPQIGNPDLYGFNASFHRQYGRLVVYFYLDHLLSNELNEAGIDSGHWDEVSALKARLEARVESSIAIVPEDYQDMAKRYGAMLRDKYWDLQFEEVCREPYRDYHCRPEPAPFDVHQALYWSFLAYVNDRDEFEEKMPAGLSHIGDYDFYSGQVEWYGHACGVDQNPDADFWDRVEDGLYQWDCAVRDTEKAHGVYVATVSIIGSEAKDLVVSFRGTDSLEDALLDLEVGQRTDPVFDDPAAKVHDGFYALWDLYRAHVKDAVRSSIEENGGISGIRKIYVVGHSLGAAVASLAMPEISGMVSREYGLADPRRLMMINFGSPRVGNDVWSDLYDEMDHWFSYVRVHNTHDIVTHIPFDHEVAIGKLSTTERLLVSFYETFASLSWFDLASPIPPLTQKPYRHLSRDIEFRGDIARIGHDLSSHGDGTHPIHEDRMDWAIRLAGFDVDVVHHKGAVYQFHAHRQLLRPSWELEVDESDASNAGRCESVTWWDWRENQSAYAPVYDRTADCGAQYRVLCAKVTNLREKNDPDDPPEVGYGKVQWDTQYDVGQRVTYNEFLQRDGAAVCPSGYRPTRTRPDLFGGVKSDEFPGVIDGEEHWPAPRARSAYED